MEVIIIVLIVLILAILVSCIKIVPQAQAYVVERLGAYQGTWSVGMHFKMPFIDRVARRVNLKEQVADFPPQPVITKDNVHSVPLVVRPIRAGEGTALYHTNSSVAKRRCIGF